MDIQKTQGTYTLNILYVWDKMYLEKKKSYCVSKQGAMRGKQIRLNTKDALTFKHFSKTSVTKIDLEKS